MVLNTADNVCGALDVVLPAFLQGGVPLVYRAVRETPSKS